MPAAISMPTGNPIPIEIEVTIVDLSPEQVRHFKGNLEFWDETAGAFVAGPLSQRLKV